ncbi:hypothetical protein Tco_1438173 [Tanacetum coccineum]
MKGVDLFVDDYCAFLEVTLDGDEGTSSRAASAPLLRLGKRLGSPPNVVLASSYGPAFIQKGIVVVGSSGKVGLCQLDPMDALARGAFARDQDYDQIPEDDFATASLGEEIDLTLYPLTPGPYVMSYPFVNAEGGVSHEYTRQQWDGSNAPEENILCKEIFKDLDVCRRALDRTITPAKLKRIESLSLVQLSNRMNFLTALLASHGVEMNSLYSALVALNTRLREKFSAKRVMFLNFVLRSSDELARTNAKLSDQALVVRDLRNELSLESSGIDCLAQKFLSSDEFNAALARILTFSITSRVERGLWMGCTDAQFEEASRNIAEASEGVLSEIVNIQPDKLTLSAVPASVPVSSFAVDKTFGWTFASKGYFSFPGDSGRGPTMSIPYFLKVHADVTDIISSFGSLGTVAYA